MNTTYNKCDSTKQGCDLWSIESLSFFCGTVDLSTSNNLQQIFFLMVDYWCLWVYGRSFHAYNNYRSTIRFVPLNHLCRWSFWWSLHHLEMYLCCDFGGVELLLLETWRSQVKLLGLFIVSDSENPWKTSGELYLTCFFFGFYCLRYNLSNQKIFIEIAIAKERQNWGIHGDLTNENMEINQALTTWSHEAWRDNDLTDFVHSS